MQKFVSPFVPSNIFAKVVKFAEKSVAQCFRSIRFCNDKIHVSIDFQLPTLLLPQQASSPNLIVFNTGTCENGFARKMREPPRVKLNVIFNFYHNKG